MKILVDKMPDEAKECLFSHYNQLVYGYECLFTKDSTFGWDKICYFKKNRECPYLAEIK